MEVNSIRSSRMRPVSWSTSYLLRCPLGISMVTSNSTVYRLLWVRDLRSTDSLAHGGPRGRRESG